jgi:hypothetical protein
MRKKTIKVVCVVTAVAITVIISMVPEIGIQESDVMEYGIQETLVQEVEGLSEEETEDTLSEEEAYTEEDLGDLVIIEDEPVPIRSSFRDMRLVSID